MSQRVSVWAVSLVVVILSICSLPLSSLSAEEFRPTKLVSDGDSVPVTGAGKFLAFVGASSNRSGATAFSALLQGGTINSGVFKYSNGTIIPQALSGELAPTGERFKDFPATPSINNNGDVLFLARLDGPRQRTALFLRSGSNTKTFAATDEVISELRVVLLRFVEFVLTDSGTALAVAQAVAEPGNTQVILTFDGSTLKLSLQPFERTSSGNQVYMPDAAAINNRNDILFIDKVPAGPFGMRKGGAVFLKSESGSLFSVATANSSAPNGGTYAPLLVAGGFGAPTLNEVGNVAFVARIEGGGSEKSIVVGAASSFGIAAVAGQSAPGGGYFTDFSNLHLEDDGSLTFEGLVEVTPAGSPDRSFRKGVFVWRSGTVATVIQEGSPLIEGVLSKLLTVRFNKGGVVAFVGSVTSSKVSTGIYMGSVLP